MAAAPQLSSTDYRAFIPFAKVDVEQRLVYGFASTPTKDLQDEIVTVEAIKAALPEYLPWGNIREMHQPSAVGVCKNADIIEGGDKDKEGLYIAAKIVDNDAWMKVREGVYKGFSIGGEKLQKVGDTVTKLKLYEISIVDRPANPECRIDYFKAVGLDRSGGMAGAGAEVSFDRREVGFLARLMAKMSGKGIGDDDYARDGFSRPAPGPTTVNGGNPANRGPVGPSEPVHILSEPSMTPVPSADAVLNDIPTEDRNRILLMAGKYHVFGKGGGKPIGGSPFPGNKEGLEAAAKALKAHLEEFSAQKMLRKAERRARKAARLERAPVEIAKMLKRERTFLAKRHIEHGHRRKFIKVILAVVQPNGTKKNAKLMTRKRLIRALTHLQEPKIAALYKRADVEAMEKGILGALSARGLLKKEESTANINDLPDSDFAHIEPGGSKDDEGKTTPRSLRHLPIHDASHVRNAAARLNQTDISPEAKAKAHRKIKARGKEFGVEVSDPSEEKKALKAARKARKLAKKALRKGPDVSAALDEARRIANDIAAEGEDEGGDPRDATQAARLNAVISQIEHASEDDDPFNDRSAMMQD